MIDKFTIKEILSFVIFLNAAGIAVNLYIASKILLRIDLVEKSLSIISRVLSKIVGKQ